MEQKRTSVWGEGLAINLISNAVSICVGCAVTYFTHAGSTWIKPVLCGGAGWLMTFCSILAYRIMKTIPRRAVVTTVDNVESRVKLWIDNFKLEIKNSPDKESYFRYRITTDSHAVIILRRPQGDFSEYIMLSALMGASDVEKKAICDLSQDERDFLTIEVKLELSRAKMGYYGFTGIGNDFTITRRVPITPALTEEALVSSIGEVEAAVNTCFLVGIRAVKRSNKLKTDSDKLAIVAGK